MQIYNDKQLWLLKNPGYGLWLNTCLCGKRHHRLGKEKSGVCCRRQFVYVHIIEEPHATCQARRENIRSTGVRVERSLQPYAVGDDTALSFQQPISETNSHFNSRFRKQGKSVAAFVAELCTLAEFCNYRDSLEIRDRIVCGIMHACTVKSNRGCWQRSPTLKRTVEIAQGMETALKNAKELSQQEADCNEPDFAIAERSAH